MQTKQVRSELIIFGLEEIEGKMCTDIATDFFKEQMLIEDPPSITHAYWKGHSANKPMVLRFANPSTKGLIFSNISNLKGKQNTKKRNCRIADHLPEELDEMKQRQQQIVYQNKQLEGSQLTTSFHKGDLLVNGERYIKKVATPSAKTLLKMGPEDLSDVKELSLSGGYSFTESGSRFISYACKVCNLQEVWKAYIHLKRAHAEANHVTMAYRLAGLNKAYDEDYLDDRETKAGRKLLDLLITKESVSIAVFVVRYYGGKHMGNRRFEIHKDLIKKALRDLDREVFFKSKLELKQFNEYNRKPARRAHQKPSTRQPVRTPVSQPLYPTQPVRNTTSGSLCPPRPPVAPSFGARGPNSMAYNRFMALSTQTSMDDDSEFGTQEA